jgi:hypothetical protein
MEAGIEPALPPGSSYPTVYKTTVQLCQVCVLLIHHLMNTHTSKEHKLLLNMLATVNSHMSINISTIPYVYTIEDPTEERSKLLYYQSYIWKLLTNPIQSTDARKNISIFLSN